MEICALHLDSDLAAVPMAQVREVLMRPRLSRLPLAPGDLAGLVNFRGDILPVLHPDACFDRQPGSSSVTRNRVVIVQSSRGLLGLLVDQVDRMNIDAPGPPPASDWKQDVATATRTVRLIHLEAWITPLAESLSPQFKPMEHAA